MEKSHVDLYCHETITGDHSLNEADNYFLIEALESWKQFICHDDKTLYSFDISVEDLIDRFKKIKNKFKQIALNIHRISDLKENIDAQDFTVTITHIEFNHQSPDLEDLCASIEELRQLEILETLDYYFEKYGECMSLPYRDPVQLDKFMELNPGVQVMYKTFIEKMRMRCPDTESAYPKAAKSGFKSFSDFVVDYPDIAKFCFDNIQTVITLGEYYLIKKVIDCFEKNRQFIALPHGHLSQYKKFKRWDKEIGKKCDAFNEKIQAKCLNTEELYLGYIEAVAGKGTLDPNAPALYPCLANGNIYKLRDFLAYHPKVTKFFYRHIKLINELGNAYDTFFDKEEAPHSVSMFFKDSTYFNLLCELTDKVIKDKIETEQCTKSIEKSFKKIINGICNVETSTFHSGEEAWLELHNLIHTSNDTTEKRHESLHSFMQKEPKIARFFYHSHTDLIALSNAYRAQCSMHSNNIKKGGSALFKEWTKENCPEEMPENNDQLCTSINCA